MKVENIIMGNEMIVKDNESWKEMKIKFGKKYPGKVLYRIDTWKKYNYVILEDIREVFSLIERCRKLSGIYGEL